MLSMVLDNSYLGEQGGSSILTGRIDVCFLELSDSISVQGLFGTDSDYGDK